MDKHKENDNLENTAEAGFDEEEPITVPIEDSLDLHTFRPGEVKGLLDDYLTAAAEKGFREVRIIHGKGTGQLKHRVQTILERHPLVSSLKQAEGSRGGWGATVVTLKRGE